MQAGESRPPGSHREEVQTRSLSKLMAESHRLASHQASPHQSRDTTARIEGQNDAASGSRNLRVWASLGWWLRRLHQAKCVDAYLGDRSARAAALE